MRIWRLARGFCAARRGGEVREDERLGLGVGGLECIELTRMWYTQVSSQCAFISVWSTLIVSSRQRIMAMDHGNANLPTPQVAIIKTTQPDQNGARTSSCHHHRAAGHGLATKPWVPCGPCSRNYIRGEDVHHIGTPSPTAPSQARPRSRRGGSWQAWLRTRNAWLLILFERTLTGFG